MDRPYRFNRIEKYKRQRIPQVSRLRLVLGEAMARKWERMFGRKNTVRSGVLFSRYADGLKVKVDGWSQ